jgi:hypothetical protein
MTDHQSTTVRDARHECYRTYLYPTTDGYEPLIIEDPVTVYEDRNGGHLIIDANGDAHIPVPGYLSVEIHPRPGFDVFGNVVPK